ncbi:MAG: zinc dependent phospholipase C family protein [Gemmatimonadetes bacterium]|nr:zinc dependent phospholipase C family protein [Gemmatimonadota bacterium]
MGAQGVAALTEEALKTVGTAFALLLVALVAIALFPAVAHAWTPGTHIYLGESVLANLHQLPTAIADLLRAFPYDFLYGNIAADTSIAKKYAPVGRHCHAWHVGQEIHDLAPTDPLRAFGLGYLSHLAADTVAHNFFVPRQLVLTSATAALGHSYWESRFETHLGDAYARTAKEVILKDHAQSDMHLDGILSPTLFSVRTSRRLFRGMVHITESQSWQWAFQTIAENSRWDLPNDDVERHMAVAFEYVMETLGERDAAARRLDPAGEQALGLAKQMRRRTLREGGRQDPEVLRASAEDHFGLPAPALDFWRSSAAQRPWRGRTE